MTASGGPPPGGPPPQGPPPQQPMGPPPPQYGYPMGPPPVEKTVKPVIGGILIILGAILGLVSGAILMTGAALFVPVDITGLSALFVICGAVWLILSIIALIGGIFAAMRKHFGIAIIGGIFSLIVGSFIFGLIGLILVAISRSEFQ